MSRKTKSAIKITALVYVVLWVLTATWGLHDIDRAFDREFEWGQDGIGGPRIKVVRTKDVNLQDPYGVVNPLNSKNTPNQCWRCRTRGIAVAPFLIIDEAGAQYGPMAGVFGRRLAIWFFGWSHYKWIRIYGYS